MPGEKVANNLFQHTSKQTMDSARLSLLLSVAFKVSSHGACTYLQVTFLLRHRQGPAV